jgi:Mn2+/Fe2+ NRAMP family transporter
MINLLNKIKFEHVFLILVFISLMVSVFVFKTDKETVDKLIVALVATLTSVIAYIFTKYNPSKG